MCMGIALEGNKYIIIFFLDGVMNYGCIVDAKNQTESAVTLANVTIVGPGHIALVYYSTSIISVFWVYSLKIIKFLNT